MVESLKPLGKKVVGIIDRSPDSSSEVAATFAGIIGFLEQLPQEKRELDEELLIPRAAVTRAIARLKFAQNDGRVTDPVQVVDMVYEDGIPFEYLWSACARLNISLPGEKDLEDYIQTRFFGNGAVSDAGLNFKFDPKELIGGGKKWLEEYVSASKQAENMTPETMDRLQVLAKDISSKYGASAAAITRLMFMMGVEETTVQRFVQARMAEANKTLIPRGNPEHKNFFEKMQDFLGVYIDITTKVIRNAKPGTKEATEEHSKEVLSRFMKSRLLQIPYLEPGEEFPDPFSVFTTMMRSQKDMNPWILKEASDTIFDVTKFHHLIAPEVGRGLVADAVFFLNNYKEALFIQDIHQLLNDIDAYVEKRRAEGRPAETERRFGKRMDDAAKEVLTRIGQKESKFEQFKGKRHLIEQFASRQSRSLSAFAVLLRILDAEKIARDPNAKTQLNDLVSGIPNYGIEADNLFKTQILAASVQILSEDQNPYFDVPQLGLQGNLSIRSMFVNKSQNWFDQEILDRGPYAHSTDPRRPAERPLITPRDLLGISQHEIERARMNFNTAKGASWTLTRKWINDAGEAMSHFPDSYKPILNFTRGEADRQWNNPGEYVTAFHPSASDAMGDIVSNLFPPITDQDYIIGTHGEYDSMLSPFLDKGAQFFAVHCNDREHGRAKTEAEIFAEIKSIIERESAKRGGKLPLTCFVSSKTRLGDAVGVVPLETRIRKTRNRETGELMERETEVGERTPNAFGLAKLIERYEQTYPGSKVIVDFSQSLGRNDRGEDLNIMKPHIMIASGGKAPGIRNISVAMIRKTPEDKQASPALAEPTIPTRDFIRVASATPEEHWRGVWKDPLSKLTPGKGTIDTARIAALGIALQHLNSKTDTWGMRKKEGKKKTERLAHMTERELLAEHHGRLTEHAIREAQSYPMRLLQRLQATGFPIPIEDPASLLGDPETQKQFGCNVVYPVHRKKVDYTFVTLAFPNLGSVERKEIELKDGGKKEVPIRTNYLARSLERAGYSRGHAGEQCMLGGNGFRVSFNNHQNEESIDKLFTDVVDVHVAFLRREVEKSKEEVAKTGDPSREIKTFEDLRTRTPNVREEEWVED